MVSVGIKLHNMKEAAFPVPTQTSGLVQAFLELDESDEEFLDFQFRIADANANANANLREREASERLADWRASFASLQLKQAHEVAEFALTRRKEDEVRIDSQAKEISQLRRSVEDARLEIKQVKANCAVVTEANLKAEEQLAHQRRMCNIFRENAKIHSEAQDRMLLENMEMKRALDEAIVTTCRLKVALEEKAAELVAWLGQEGFGPQGLYTLGSDGELVLKTEETSVNERNSGAGSEALLSAEGRNTNERTSTTQAEPCPNAEGQTANDRNAGTEGEFSRTAEAKNANDRSSGTECELFQNAGGNLPERSSGTEGDLSSSARGPVGFTSEARQRPGTSHIELEPSKEPTAEEKNANEQNLYSAGAVGTIAKESRQPKDLQTGAELSEEAAEEKTNGNEQSSYTVKAVGNSAHECQQVETLHREEESRNACAEGELSRNAGGKDTNEQEFYPDSSEESQQSESLHADKESFKEPTAVSTSKQEEDILTASTEEMITALEGEFEDMKHEVLVGRPNQVSLREGSEDDLTERGGGQPEHISSAKGTEVVLSLRQKISDLQTELERLESLENLLKEEHSNNSFENWNSKRSLLQAFNDLQDHHENKISSSTRKESEVIEISGPALAASSSDAPCTDDEIAHGQLSEHCKSDIQVDNAVSASQIRESFAHLGRTEASSDPRGDLEDKFICVNTDDPWSIETMGKLVETITEELTKLQRVVVKRPSTPNHTTFADLETQLRSWNNITTKTLQSKVSTRGSVEEWKSLVVDVLGQSRQELMTLQQRLCDCESELSVVDKLQAECLESSQNLGLLTQEIQKLEEQSFNDNIEREEEVNQLKVELQRAKQIIAGAQSKIAEEQMTVLALREQLHESEIELESAKLGWGADQEFVNSGPSCDNSEPEKKEVMKEEVGRTEERIQGLMFRLEENDRELGELLIISGVDKDSVAAAKIGRLEQQLEDAKVSEATLLLERSELASQVTSMKSRLADVEYELELDNQEHVGTLIRYEEEHGNLEASSRSETRMVQAKLSRMEQLLAEKTKQLENLQGEEDGMSASQTQLQTLHARVLSLESNLAITQQNAVDCEAAGKLQLKKEKEKFASLEKKFSVLQRNSMGVKKQLSESEQKERRAQSKTDNLLVELGIAKEEVLKYEIRLQKNLRQAKEDVDAEKRKHDTTMVSQKQMEWHLCRQIELAEGLERDKAKLHELLEDYELQNSALHNESDKLRTAYIQLARRSDQRSG